MKKSRLIFQVSLFAILTGLLIFERYTAEKTVDESNYITSKTTQSPLSSHSDRIGHFRTKNGDRISSLLNQMKAAGLPVYENEIIPEFDKSLQNGGEDFKAALGLISKSKEGSAIYELSTLWKSKNKLTKDDLKIISELLEDTSVDKLMDLVRKASEKDYLDFNLDYSQGPGMILPHLGSTRNLMKILSLKSYIDSEKGRSAEAVETLNVALKLNSIPTDDITMIGELVENAVMGILNENVMDLSSSGADLSETYKILESSLANANDRQLLTIDGERHFFGSWVYDKMLNSPEEIQGELKSLFGPGIADMPPEEIKEQYAEYLKTMFEVRELMEEPYYKNSEKLKEKEKSMQSSVLLKELLPSYSSIYKKFHQNQSLLKKSLLTLKVHEYESKYGVKPETLDILNVPQDYLKDNISGQSYQLIYSTGGKAIITFIGDNSGGLKL